ncbi:MAG: hypothetical protein KatS3mg127_1122 [Silanimonas sp.]|nr:MAG: hypothetical protein KatS3mg127_1122 [Silanimonas sp.]
MRHDCRRNHCPANAEALWVPEKYWAWQDRLWREAMPGQVTVGEVEARPGD